MGSVSTFSWILIGILAIPVSILAGFALIHWRSRQQMLSSVKYLSNRLHAVEADLRQLDEHLYVLREYLARRGVLDEEDLYALRRELIEKPRQQEAERQELIKRAGSDDIMERLVNNSSDSIH
jgi:hypothetical protein